MQRLMKVKQLFAISAPIFPTDFKVFTDIELQFPFVTQFHWPPRGFPIPILYQRRCQSKLMIQMALFFIQRDPSLVPDVKIKHEGHAI